MASKESSPYLVTGQSASSDKGGTLSFDARSDRSHSAIESLVFCGAGCADHSSGCSREGDCHIENASRLFSKYIDRHKRLWVFPLVVLGREPGLIKATA